MPIDIVCSQCQRVLRAPDKAAGSAANCPQCGARVEIPLVLDASSEISGSGMQAAPTYPSYPATNPGYPAGNPGYAWANPNYPGPQGYPYQGGYGSPPPPAIPSQSEFSPAMRFVLPVQTSWVAIVAGYLGLFSVLLLPAPFAIGFGIWAIFHIRADKNRHGMGRAIFAIVMGLLSFAILIFALLRYL